MKWTVKVILPGESSNEVLILDIILIDVTFFNFSLKKNPDYMFFIEFEQDVSRTLTK